MAGRGQRGGGAQGCQKSASGAHTALSLSLSLWCARPPRPPPTLRPLSRHPAAPPLLPATPRARAGTSGATRVVRRRAARHACATHAAPPRRKQAASVFFSLSARAHLKIADAGSRGLSSSASVERSRMGARGRQCTPYCGGELDVASSMFGDESFVASHTGCACACPTRRCVCSLERL